MQRENNEKRDLFQQGGSPGSFRFRCLAESLPEGNTPLCARRLGARRRHPEASEPIIRHGFWNPLGIQVPSQKVFGVVWRVQVPSENVLGSLGILTRTADLVPQTLSSPRRKTNEPRRAIPSECEFDRGATWRHPESLSPYDATADRRGAFGGWCVRCEAEGPFVVVRRRPFEVTKNLSKGTDPEGV